jgi:hypothetical protein
MSAALDIVTKIWNGFLLGVGLIFAAAFMQVALHLSLCHV